MALQDELLTQKIEVLLDMQAKRMKADIQLLRDELSQVKEELRKEIHSIKQDPSHAPPGGSQMYSDAPVQQQAPEQVPRYAQQQQQQPQYQQQAPQYQQAPQQNYPQQNYPQQQQQYPPQQQQGYPQAGRMDREAPPVAKPIDRNGVAPSEVSVEKFFYMGGKANKK